MGTFPLKRKNKKAIILPNALSAIVAIIILFLILFASYKFIYRGITEDEKESARNLVDKITAKIQALKEGESGDIDARGVNSDNNWYLIGWKKGEDNRPDKCFFKSCICVCPEATEDSCQENGFCNPLEFGVSTISYLHLDGEEHEQFCNPPAIKGIKLISKKLNVIEASLKNNVINLEKHLGNVAAYNEECIIDLEEIEDLFGT